MLKTTIARTAIAAVLSIAAAGAASAAAIIGLQVEGGGTQQVYLLDNGNYLGLWGFDAREGAVPGNTDPITIASEADILGGFTSGGGNIVEFYNGLNPVNPGAAAFDELAFGFDVADNARLFDSLWIEWTGGTLVYQQPSGGTTTMAARVTLDGDPFPTDVPEPAALLLLGAGVAGLGALRRRAK